MFSETGLLHINLEGNKAMTGKTAGLMFLGVCIVLAFLLLTHAISPVVSGTIFAGSLLLFGSLSSGFRRR